MKITKAHKQIAELMVDTLMLQRMARVYLEEEYTHKSFQEMLARRYPNLILVELKVTK